MILDLAALAGVVIGAYIAIAWGMPGHELLGAGIALAAGAAQSRGD